MPTAAVFGSFFLILFLTTWIERRPVLAICAALFSRALLVGSQSNSRRSTVAGTRSVRVADSSSHTDDIPLTVWNVLCTHTVGTEYLQTNRTTGLSMTRCGQSSSVLTSRWQTDDQSTGYGVGSSIDFSAGFTGSALHRGHRISGVSNFPRVEYNHYTSGIPS